MQENKTLFSHSARWRRTIPAVYHARCANFTYIPRALRARCPHNTLHENHLTPCTKIIENPQRNFTGIPRARHAREDVRKTLDMRRIEKMSENGRCETITDLRWCYRRCWIWEDARCEKMSDVRQKMWEDDDCKCICTSFVFAEPFAQTLSGKSYSWHLSCTSIRRPNTRANSCQKGRLVPPTNIGMAPVGQSKQIWSLCCHAYMCQCHCNHFPMKPQTP